MKAVTIFMKHQPESFSAQILAPLELELTYQIIDAKNAVTLYLIVKNAILLQIAQIVQILIIFKELQMILFVFFLVQEVTIIFKITYQRHLKLNFK